MAAPGDKPGGTSPVLNLPAMDAVASATKLRREMMDVQSQLEAKRTEFRERMERVRQREVVLQKQKEQLQERLVKFYKLIQENDIKKNRAEKKAVAEQRAKDEKQKQILALMTEAEQLERHKADLRERLQKFQKFQKYLEEVLAYNEEYQHPTDISQRHSTLDANNRELQLRKKELEDEVEAQKLALQRKKKQKEDEILDYTNHLSKLQDALETSTKHTIQTSDNIESTVEIRSNNLRVIGQVKMAVENLYSICVDIQRASRKGRGPGHPQDDEVQSDILLELSFIGDCLTDFLLIIEKDQERQKALAAAGAGGGALTMGAGSPSAVATTLVSPSSGPKTVSSSRSGGK